MSCRSEEMIVNFALILNNLFTNIFPNVKSICENICNEFEASTAFLAVVPGICTIDVSGRSTLSGQISPRVTKWHTGSMYDWRMYTRLTLKKEMLKKGRSLPGGGGGGDFIPSLPICVCPKVMDMSPFLASSE